MKERMNPYEQSGMYRSAVDFAVDDHGMAFLPRSGEIANQQGIERIGEQFGVVGLGDWSSICRRRRASTKNDAVRE